MRTDADLMIVESSVSFKERIDDHNQRAEDEDDPSSSMFVREIVSVPEFRVQ